MNSRPVLASLLCASLASFAPTSAYAQLSPAGLNAAGQLATALALQAEPINTSVLGLRSDDAKGGQELTKALRKAFAEREMSGGQELTLEEVILTLDCSSEADTACMTEAGRALETERLVYGSLSAGTLMIDVLDVTSGQIEANVEMPLDEVDLAPENIDATAAEVVNSLYPQSDPAVIAATPTAADGTESGDDDGDPVEETPESPYVWGPYKPRPTWKKVGLGVSATVMIAGLTTGIVTGVLGSVVYANRVEDRKNALAANDIDGDELTVLSDAEEEELTRAGKGNKACDIAQIPARFRYPNENRANAVIDADAARYCVEGQQLTRVANIGWGVFAVGAVATTVFTVLHFVHRDKGPTSDARRRSFRLTGGPARGGAVLGATGRF